MSRLAWTALGLSAALLLAAPSRAQQPAPAPAPIPDNIPFDIPYGTPITLERAKQAAAAAEAEAKKRNWKYAITVVGPTGEFIYAAVMDGTMYGSFQISQDKALSAARFRRPTEVFFNAVQAGNVYLLNLRGMSAIPGGFPLVEGGKVIGAIGCSGGTGPQDALICKTGADTVK